jgi:transposase-like protein
MAVRRPNAGLIKIHRSYSIEETARTLGVHKNTVANWLKNGLRSIDDRRPVLVQGLVLRTFLQERRSRQKKRCAIGELYCLKCRAPKSPSGEKAIYIPLSSSGGNLKGRCSDCLSIVCRRVSIARLHEFSAVLTISYRQAQPRINERSAPCLKCELGDA